MILFIAPNPHKVKEREGFLQRVYAIDQLLPNEEKIYFEDLSSTTDQAKALIESRVIYVHSVYHANKILKSYSKFSHKIITDLHGAVPEEEEYASNWEMASIAKVTEKEVFKRGRYFVAVTASMVKHFESKYPGVKRDWAVLPIFENLNSTRSKEVKVAGKKEVIYAGGAQPWQNVQAMKDAVFKTKDRYKFVILTQSVDAFSDIVDQDGVVIKTVPSESIAKYYKSAQLGFVLRDDNLVNRVACPTKLIEYFAYGVLPIVKSEYIGDFNEMGYSFVKLSDFLKKPITEEKINEGIKNNFQVYSTLIKQTEEGKAKLTRLVKGIKPNKNNKASVDLVSLEIDYQKDVNQMLRYEYQIDIYKTKIGEYADAVKYYKNIAEGKVSRKTRIKNLVRKRT